MADTPISEYAEVKVNGQIYRDWTSVVVRFGVETPIPIFRLQTVEATDKQSGQSETSGQFQSFLKISAGHRVDVSVGGKNLIQDGYVKERQVSYDDTRHAVQIAGLAKAGPALEASVDRKDVQFQNYKLEALANKLLEPLKVKFKVLGKPAHIDIPFPNFIVFRGERIFEAVDRLCRQRGLWLWGDGEGNLVAGDGSGEKQADLTEGQNILSLKLYEEYPGADTGTWQGSNKSSDEQYGREPAEVSAKGDVKNGDQGKIITGLAEGLVDKKSIVAHQEFAQAAESAATMRVIIEHQGWFVPGTTKLWQIREGASVYSPMAFLPGKERQDLRVWSATWAQSGSGTTCTVELVNAAAFGRGSTQSGAPTFPDFGSQAQQPQPEPVPEGGSQQ